MTNRGEELLASGCSSGYNITFIKYTQNVSDELHEIAAERTVTGFLGHPCQRLIVWVAALVIRASFGLSLKCDAGNVALSYS